MKFDDYEDDEAFMVWLRDMEARYAAGYDGYYELLYEAWLAGRASTGVTNEHSS